MIKFFRQIKFNLVSENKTGKYFKDAIGQTYKAKVLKALNP